MSEAPSRRQIPVLFLSEEFGSAPKGDRGGMILGHSLEAGKGAHEWGWGWGGG